MAYITRELERKFLKLNDFFKVILVTGARQVGKTTMLKHLAEADAGKTGKRIVAGAACKAHRNPAFQHLPH